MRKRDLAQVRSIVREVLREQLCHQQVSIEQWICNNQAYMMDKIKPVYIYPPGTAIEVPEPQSWLSKLWSEVWS